MFEKADAARAREWQYSLPLSDDVIRNTGMVEPTFLEARDM
jgi:hypothetical protein